MRGFLFVFVYFLIVAILAELVVTSKCPAIKVRKDTIIRTKESVRNGAKLIKRTNVRSSRTCYELCCNAKDCSIGVMHYERVRTFNDVIKPRKTCFLFTCKPNQCSFVNHGGYAVIEMQKEKLPAKKEPQSTIPREEKCPPGSPVAMCLSNPCETAVCPGHKGAICVPSFCGQCGYVFYDASGKKLQCEGDKKSPKPKPNDKDVTNLSTVEPEGEKEGEREGNGQVVKEEEIEVHPEEAGAKPKEELFPAGKEAEEDPHKVKEYREWLGSKDEVQSSVTPKTEVKTDNGAPAKPGQPLLKKKTGKTIIFKKESSISWALLIALSICIAILLLVIIKVKCLGPKKKKKFAVDDGDYLINGMYL